MDLFPEWIGPQGEGSGTSVAIGSGGGGGGTIIEYIEKKKPKIHMKFSDSNYGQYKKPRIKLKIKTKE